MAISDLTTDEVRNRLDNLRNSRVVPTPKSVATLFGRSQEAARRTEEKISERPSAIKELTGASPFKKFTTAATALGVGDPISSAVPEAGRSSAIMKLGAAALEGLESIPANIGLGIQQRKGIVGTAKDVAAGLTGDRPAQIGDIPRASGIPVISSEPVSAAIGLGATAAPFSGRIKTAARELPGTRGLAKERAIPFLGKKVTRPASKILNPKAIKTEQKPRRLFGKRGPLEAPKRAERLSGLELERTKHPFTKQVEKLDIEQKGRIKEVRTATEGKVKSLRQAESIKQQVQAKEIQELKVKRKLIGKTLGKTARERVVELRKTLPRAAKRHSEVYERFVERGLDDAEKQGITIDAEELISRIEKVVPNDPELVTSISNELGISSLTKKVSLPGTGGQVSIGDLPAQLQSQLKSQLKTGTTVSPRAVHKAIKSFRQTISRASKQGSRSYSPKEKLAEDLSSALGDLLENKCVKGLKEANTFWRQWAPIRDQAFTEFKPFLPGQLKSSQGLTRLIKVAGGNDPGNEQLIREVEKRTGTNLTSKLEGIIAKLDSTQKKTFSSNLESKLLEFDIKQEGAVAEQKIQELFLGKKRGVEQAATAVERKLKRQQFARSVDVDIRQKKASQLVTIGRWLVIYSALGGLVFGSAGTVTRAVKESGFTRE